MSTSRRTVRRGSSGIPVPELQSVLNDRTQGLNIKLVVDGKFGPLTESAVRKFQKQYGCEVDGIVGPETWGTVDEVSGAGPRDRAPRGQPKAVSPAQDGAGPPKPGNTPASPAPPAAPAKPRVGPPRPDASGFARQTTQDDCGYFAHYCLADYDARRTLAGGFTQKDVLEERDSFFRKRGVDGHLYLGYSAADEFMNHLGEFGYSAKSALAIFDPKVDAQDTAAFLVHRMGRGGVTITCNDFAKIFNLGHWIAILAIKEVAGSHYFFVYDSSSTLIRMIYNDKETTDTVGWAPWRPMIAFLQSSRVGFVISKY
ncbi:MAG: peptidoglycan-binding domain-containing protein [Pseudomonadota bacterium]